VAAVQLQPEPQAVLEPLTRAALILVLTCRPGSRDTVRDLLADVSGLVRSVGFRAPEASLSCITGVGSELWDGLFAGPRPAELHPFRELRGARHHAPATAGDLLFHIRAQRMDLCFELATHLTDRLRDAADVADETQGFLYFDDRDLMGFVDGTENPAGAKAVRAAIIGAEDPLGQADSATAPAFAGGSYVIVQKYLHDLRTWNALPVEEQEKVIGRTKLSDLELSDEAKPADSHVALNTIEGPDGDERQILRLNMPFGSFAGGEFGTYFIGYCYTPSVTEQMLQNMFLGNPRGANHDRILDFSTAVTGSLFFVPPAEFLDDQPDPPGQPKPSAQSVPAAPSAAAAVARPSDPIDPAATRSARPSGDGSLGIGSLKRSSSR
jgi:putative iron-dependent peroxidase